jgi:hypothetical protein
MRGIDRVYAKFGRRCRIGGAEIDYVNGRTYSTSGGDNGVGRDERPQSAGPQSFALAGLDFRLCCTAAPGNAEQFSEPP